MKRRGLRSGGFTLLEALFAVVLIGLAVVSLVAASGAFTMVNGASLELSTAEFLIEEIREMTAAMDYDVLAALDGTTFNPPADFTGAAITDLGAYTQQITVRGVSPSSLTTPDDDSDILRVRVSILKNGKTVSSADWIRTRER
jgi:type II secretory pathway pseudopilin PulG